VIISFTRDLVAAYVVSTIRHRRLPEAALDAHV